MSLMGFCFRKNKIFCKCWEFPAPSPHHISAAESYSFSTSAFFNSSPISSSISCTISIPALFLFHSPALLQHLVLLDPQPFLIFLLVFHLQLLLILQILSVLQLCFTHQVLASPAPLLLLCLQHIVLHLTQAIAWNHLHFHHLYINKDFMSKQLFARTQSLTVTEIFPT